MKVLPSYVGHQLPLVTKPPKSYLLINPTPWRKSIYSIRALCNREMCSLCCIWENITNFESQLSAPPCASLYLHFGIYCNSMCFNSSLIFLAVGTRNAFPVLLRLLVFPKLTHQVFQVLVASLTWEKENHPTSDK